MATARSSLVDLNPLRAGMAATPEQSDFTSIQDRVVAHKARQQLARAPQDPNPEQKALIETAPGLRPVLARLELDVDALVANVEAYGGLFRRIAGKTQRLGELARATGRAWLHGHCGARKRYVKTT